tara:strand:- start:410 stop:778 length:369 start_codon:yes stop_codon:yes gene_type:complete
MARKRVSRKNRVSKRKTSRRRKHVSKRVSKRKTSRRKKRVSKRKTSRRRNRVSRRRQRGGADGEIDWEIDWELCSKCNKKQCKEGHEKIKKIIQREVADGSPLNAEHVKLSKCLYEKIKDLN